MADDNSIRIGEVTANWARHQQLPVHFAKTMESTNDLAKKEAFDEAGADGLKIYLCEDQTKGRGRGSNTWSHGRPGSALLSSWSFLLQDPPAPVLSPRVGLALYTAAAATWPFMPWSLKAPNDLYLNNQKVAGLLLENISQGEDQRLIVGLGLNVIVAPSEIPHCTSLAQELGPNTPLLGEDWISFLERWLFELSISVGRMSPKLNSTECAALRQALNARAGLAKPITEVMPDGGLRTGSDLQSWIDL